MRVEQDLCSLSLPCFFGLFSHDSMLTTQIPSPAPLGVQHRHGPPQLSFGKSLREDQIQMNICYKRSIQVVMSKSRCPAYGLCTGACGATHKRRTGLYGFRMAFVRVIFFCK